MAAGGHHADTADDLRTVGGRSRDIVGAQRGGGGVSGDQEGREEGADTAHADHTLSRPFDQRRQR